MDGSDVRLRPGPSAGPDEGWTVGIDGGPEQVVRREAGLAEIALAKGLPAGQHNVVLRPLPGTRPAIDSLTVEQRRSALPWIAAGAVALALVLATAALVGGLGRRRRWYERGRGWE
jgi:hypothetical protein